MGSNKGVHKVHFYINNQNDYGIRRVGRNGHEVGCGEPNGYSSWPKVLRARELNNWTDAAIVCFLPPKSKPNAVKRMGLLVRALRRNNMEFLIRRGK